MPDRVEVARQIQINHCGHAPQHTAPDFRQGAVWRPLRSKSIGVGAKIRLEDSFQNQLHCALHHAVADTRNLKRSEFALSLRDLHPAVRPGLIPACDEVFPHCRKKRRSPRRLDVLEFLAIDPGGTAVALRYTVSLFEGLNFRDVHEQTPETMSLVRLRLSIDPPPQFLQTDGRFCHFTPASPWLAEYLPVRALPSGRVLLHAHRRYCDPIRHPGAYACISHSRLWPASPRRDFFAGHRGLLQFPHHPSHHVAADTPPVRAAASDSFRPALAAFARYRPSQPPVIRVTRLRLRSLHVATWCVAHTPFEYVCRRAPPSCFRATAPPQLRVLSLLTSVGLSPTGQCVLDWTRRSPSVRDRAPPVR